MNLSRITRIITHANCPDGIASAMILHDALPDASVEFVQYGTPEHRDMHATPGMLFCDITPPRERVSEFVGAGAMVLDHHAAQKDIVDAFGENGVYACETGKSGAWLAYWHVWRNIAFNACGIDNDNVKHFARLAGIRDTWWKGHELWTEACEQAAALMFLGLDYFKDHAPWLTREERFLGKVAHAKRLISAKEIAASGTIFWNGWRVFNDSEHLRAAAGFTILDPRGCPFGLFQEALYNAQFF